MAIDHKFHELHALFVRTPKKDTPVVVENHILSECYDDIGHTLQAVAPFAVKHADEKIGTVPADQQAELATALIEASKSFISKTSLVDDVVEMLKDPAYDGCVVFIHDGSEVC